MTDMQNIRPTNISEALAAWDAGQPVLTVEMGGLGDGYEMAIQCVVFELLREITTNAALLQIVEQLQEGERFPTEFLHSLDDYIMKLDSYDEEAGTYALGGLSGAQAGAAKNLALVIAKHGYDPVYKLEAEDPGRCFYVQRRDPTMLLVEDYRQKAAEEPEGETYYKDRLAEIEAKYAGREGMVGG